MAKDRAKTMPLGGHLKELRKRVLYCVIVLVACVIAAYFFRDELFKVLLAPLQGTETKKLTTLGVTEAFMQVVKVCIYTGLLVSSPFLLYQFWAFIMPALYKHERRDVFLFTLLTTVLFLGGVVFAYYLVLPVGLRFLIGFGGETFDQLLRAESYFSFVSMFMLVFGAVFELPLVMLLLSWAHVVDHHRMRKVRKYAVVVEAIVAAVFTPSQDPLSMLLMLLPLMLLYEVGIWLASFVAKRRARGRQLPEAT